MKKAEILKSGYPCAAGFELDLIDGCDVGCIYCSLSSSNSAEALDVEDVMSCPVPLPAVYISPNSDPFSDVAKATTYKVLERFLTEGVLVALFTKRKIPDDTIRLLGKYPDLVIPTVSLARLDQELNSYIEPGAATAQERLDTIKVLADSGLKVKARLNPLYPGIDDTDECLGRIIGAYADAGVYAVKTAYVVVRDSKPTRWMVEKMTDHPVLRKGWEQMTETIKIHKGKGNVPPHEKRVDLYRRVGALCDEHGLKFAVCSVLDLPVLEDKPQGVPVCSNIMIFYGKHVRSGVWTSPPQ